ncbi:hypothetical protein PoB_000400800 [Plakobranchus ocellatus]|uniref:Uncharacterized protein n=1 Tax=Plakobranchus ocellatus TaxID=259542 RepID=A0AAV3Y515_9GAST|nr:hypothetical protein PoB_000400800 [Plakobranchus ocellatus]
MELANLTYRGGPDRGGTMSDSEMSTGRRRHRNIPDNAVGRSSTMHHEPHQNLPIYLVEPGRLPGIPKGRKVRKKRPFMPGNNKTSSGNMAAKSFDIIDTNRTDISKMSSDFHVGDFIDTNRTLGTEGSDLDYQHFLPYHHQLLPGPTAYTRTTPLYPAADGPSAATNPNSSAADARFPELNPLTPISNNSIPTSNNNNTTSGSSALKIAHGYGHSQQPSPYLKAGTSNPASLTPGRWAQNELALPLGRNSVKGVRRALGEPRPPDSAPSLDQSPSRLKQPKPTSYNFSKRFRGVSGTVACESALRSAGTLLFRVRAPPSTPRPDGGP